MQFTGLTISVCAVLCGIWPITSSAQEEAPVSVAQDAPASVPSAAGYHKGFFVRDPGSPFDMHIQGRVQVRYTSESHEGARNEAAFSIARARLGLSGRAFIDNLKYKFQADFGKGAVTLKDYFVDYGLLANTLHLRVGQWKRPFSRQQITSSGRLELVDRAITDKFFGAGRDIGIAIHNNYESSPTFEYALGVFNGTGDKPHLSGDVSVDPATGEGEITGGGFSNVPTHFHPALVMRLGYNYGGIKGYQEADLEGGPLRFSIGGSALADFDTDDDNRSGVRGEVDYVVKLRGLSTTGGFYVASSQAGNAFSDQSLAAIGMHLQVGYLALGRIQPVVRYAVIDPDGEDNEQQEMLAGIAVYFFEHGLKWQTDGGALVYAAGNRTDMLLRTQLQLAF
ncbi:MAG: porin [Myxococcota bacterium]